MTIDVRAAPLLMMLLSPLLSFGGCGVGNPLGGGDAGAACAQLASEADCVAAQACVADYCLECSCTPTFVGCRDAAAPKHTCPALGCPSPLCCRQPGDCVQGTMCIPPGATSCGVCLMGSCTGDSQCPGQVCDRAPCTCSPTGQACLPRCTADSCAAGSVCQADGHCRAQTCGGAAAACPRDFSCAGSACVRTGCAGDGDCGNNGFCVEGSCFPALGECRPPVP